MIEKTVVAIANSVNVNLESSGRSPATELADQRMVNQRK